MVCPKCGEPNAEDAVRCARCGGPLRPDATGAVTARIPRSRKAVASFVLALLGFIWLGFLFQFGLLAMVLVGTSVLELLHIGLPVALLFVSPWFLAILLGKRARDDIRASPAQLMGIRLARAGIILGSCNIVLALLVAVADWHMHVAEVAARRNVSHVRSDMRSLTNAIEAYMVERMITPAWGMGKTGPGGSQTYNYMVASRRDASRSRPAWYYERRKLGPFYWYKKVPYDSQHPADLPCFLLNGTAPGQRFQTLTTPVTYITTYPYDFFSPIRGATFVYWSPFPGGADPSGKIVGRNSPIKGFGWFLVSPGPDRKYDILPDDWDVYDPGVPQPSNRLLAGTNRKGHAFTYDPTNGTISDGDLWRVKQ